MLNYLCVHDNLKERELFEQFKFNRVKAHFMHRSRFNFVPKFFFIENLHTLNVLLQHQ